MSETQSENFSTRHEVCSADTSKNRRHRNPEDPVKKAARQRRHQLRKQAPGNAVLFVECRECHAPIKPSYDRAFCPGGECRKAWEDSIRPRVTQVKRVIPIQHKESSRSETFVALPHLSRVDPTEIEKRDLEKLSFRPRVSMRINLIRLPRVVRTPKQEPVTLVVPVARLEATPLSVLFPYDEPLFTLPESSRLDWKEQVRRDTFHACENLSAKVSEIVPPAEPSSIETTEKLGEFLARINKRTSEPWEFGGGEMFRYKIRHKTRSEMWDAEVPRET